MDSGPGATVGVERTAILSGLAIGFGLSGAGPELSGLLVVVSVGFIVVASALLWLVARRVKAALAAFPPEARDSFSRIVAVARRSSGWRRPAFFALAGCVVGVLFMAGLGIGALVVVAARQMT